MTLTLQQRIRQVSRHARRLVRLYGLGWFVAVLCLAAVAIGMADYWLRFEDFGIRVICFAVLCLVATWSCARFLFAAWRYRCSELQAARQIEILYPALGDCVTSAVAFSTEPNDAEGAGSVELRRAVVTETEAATEDLNFEKCLDRRQPVRALVAAAISLAVIVVLALADGPSVSLAAKRLFVPWENHPWPRRHVLQWDTAPTRLAVGQDFEAKLSDANGQLPERVEIQYWFDGDDISRVQAFQMRPWAHHFVHRLANVTRPFRYRAVGGDDQAMSWTRLRLVEPPRITTRDITLYPPAYTGVETRHVDGSFRALIGTRASVHGRVSKPLSAAVLETNTVGGNARLELTLDGDRRGFFLDDAKAEWTILQSGVYGFRLVDKDGLDIGVLDQWDVRTRRDSRPTVSLKEPAADRLVTPNARLTLEAIVKDDLAVRSVELHFLRSTSTDQLEEVLQLWTGPKRVVSVSPRTALNDDGIQKTVQHDWDLTRLPGMKPGEWIDFRVKAEDYKSQAGESGARRLTFISTEELEDRIAQRQSELLAEIAKIVRLQRDTRAQISGLEIQAREVGRLGQNDVDQLQAAELNQRQVQQRLGHPGDGVAAAVLALMNELRDNRVDNPDLATRLRQVHETITQLDEDPLAHIQHQLIDAIKIVREQKHDMQSNREWIGAASRDELPRLFESIGAGQQEVVEVLEELLSRLMQWDSYQRLAREVGQMKREQESVHGQTRQLRVETLTHNPSDFDAQQRATLKRLTQRQNDVALRFGALASRMEIAQQDLLPEDPAAAATLADALQMARDEGIGGLIRDVGRELDRRRLSQAVDGQESVIQLLEQLQDVLANRKPLQLSRMSQQLRDAAARLGEIRDRQQSVRKQTDAATSPTPERFQQWSREERELADEVDRLSRQLERQAGGAIQVPLNAAGKRLREAGDSAAAGDLDETRKRTEDARHALDEAQREMDAALQASEEAQRNEGATQLRQKVQRFLSQQQWLVDETEEAELRRQAKGTQQVSPWQERVRELASAQDALSQEVVKVRNSLSEVVAFDFALQDVVQLMSRAGQRLSSLDTSLETSELQREAVEQLQQLLDAMHEEPPREVPDGQPSEQTEDAPSKDGHHAAKYLLAQLKLVRALQQQVNQDTKLLEKEKEPWSEVLVRQQGELVRRQRQLTEIVLQLLEAGPDAARPGTVRPPSRELNSLDSVLRRDDGDKR